MNSIINPYVFLLWKHNLLWEYQQELTPLSFHFWIDTLIWIIEKKYNKLFWWQTISLSQKQISDKENLNHLKKTNGYYFIHNYIGIVCRKLKGMIIELRKSIFQKQIKTHQYIQFPKWFLRKNVMQCSISICSKTLFISNRWFSLCYFSLLLARIPC